MHYAKEEGVKVLVLTDDIDVIMDRLSKRVPAEDPRIVENIEAIDDLFLAYAKHFRLKVINTRTMTLQQIFDLVEEN